MANVKFYRLGLNGGVSKATYLEHTNTSDGRIVFAQVKGENAGDPLEHYIWASGIEYHIADVSALRKIEHTLNVLLDGAPANTSIGKMIQDALDGYELTAENFVKLVDSTNSNVKISINDSSLVLEADSATTDDVTTTKTVGYVTSGMTIPEGTTLQQLVDMIFTKIRGLEGATAPSGSISGITAATMEVGAELGSAITVTAGYTDGSWKNEESWKNSYSDNKSTQPYGSTATNYAFSGMVSGSGATNTVTVPVDYVIVKGDNKVQVVITNTNSTNVPVNEAGTALIAGSVNDTVHYKPYIAANITKTSAVIKGDYRYWIGYTETPAAEITRAIANSDLTIKTGWSGSEVVCEEQYNSPRNSYATFIVPKGMTLKTVADSFNNDVVANFTATDVNGLGADSKVYTVYQEYAAASAGIDRKNIKLN